jgi:hypothetical protein
MVYKLYFKYYPVKLLLPFDEIEEGGGRGEMWHHLFSLLWTDLGDDVFPWFSWSMIYPPFSDAASLKTY